MSPDVPTFLVGTVADPTKQNVLKVVVGRATPSISLGTVRLSNGVPACNKSISGCGLARDHTPPVRAQTVFGFGRGPALGEGMRNCL